MPPKRYFEAAEEPSGSARESVQDIGASAKTARGKGVADPSAGATLFVSRLPYTATSTDLSTLFSDIGPLKRAFVVTDPETRISKGVGYVSFAIREDAVRALETLQGRSLDGGKRKIQVDWAENRKLLGKDKGNSAEDAEATSRKHPRVESGQVKTRPAPPAGALAGPAKDPDAVRTLVLSGLKGATSAVDNKSLYKRARKIGDVERVVYPAPSATSSEPDADAAHVVYRIPNHAATAVSKLHAHTFKGALLSAVLKKRADGAARLTARMRPETAARKEKIRQALEAQGVPSVTTAAGSVGDVNRSSRLIVRNLPFDVSTCAHVLGSRMSHTRAGSNGPHFAWAHRCWKREAWGDSHSE